MTAAVTFRSTPHEQRAAAVLAAIDDGWTTLAAVVAAVGAEHFARRKNPASRREGVRIAVRILEADGQVEVKRPGQGCPWWIRRPTPTSRPSSQPQEHQHEASDAITDRP
jgi:hypothetical protein